MQRPRRGRPPKFDKILAAVRADILSGKFQPGDRLPTREELAKKFGSTKVTMQKAMDILLEEGILTARRGAGTYVTNAAESKLPYFLLIDQPQGKSRFKDAVVNEAKKHSDSRQALSTCYYKGLHYRSDELDRLYTLMARQRVAGLLIAVSALKLDGSRLLDFPEIPKVFIGTPHTYGAYPSVTNAGRRSIYRRVLDYFKEKERRSAAVIMSTVDDDLLLDSPFKGLADERDIHAPPEWIQAAPLRAPAAAARLALLMFRDPAHRPEALHIGDDGHVPAITEALATLNIRVPEDLLVTAHANFPYPTRSCVTARRIGYDAREFISNGLEFLDQQRRGETPEDREVEPVWQEEVPRGSGRAQSDDA